MAVKILFCLASDFKGLHVRSTYWLEACTLDRPSVLKFTEEDLFGYVRLKRIYLTLSGDLTF